MTAPVLMALASGGMLPSGTAQMLLVILVVGAGVFLTISIRAKIARKNAETPTPREQIEAIKLIGQARTEVDGVHASLHEIARKLSAQLDNKAERLEQLIVQADERIARLEAMDTQGIKPRPVVAGDVDECTKQFDEAGHAAVQPAPAKPQATSGSARRDAEPAQRETEAPDSLRRAVYALADSGRSPVDISRQLDEHIGKVELILALRHG